MLFYPRYHLDQSSLLCRKPLLTKPMVMDVYDNYILVTYRPFDVHIFHVSISGELTPASTPDLQVNDCFQFLFLPFVLVYHMIDQLICVLKSFQKALFIRVLKLKSSILGTFLSDKMTNSFLQYENYQS